MPVYVDAMVDYGKRIGRAGPRWCHMIADSLDELHAMADAIGMKRDWFQRASRTPHYDLGSVDMRKRAVLEGAIECDRTVFVDHMRRIRGQR